MKKSLMFFIIMVISIDTACSQNEDISGVEVRKQQVFDNNCKEIATASSFEKNDTSSLAYCDTFQAPKFNLHLALGGVNGVRIGLRSHISQNISLEFSAGIPITHFIGGGEKEERYSLGINWHQSIKSGLMFSLICSNIVQPNKSYLLSIPNNRFFSYLRLSGYIGYFTDILPGFTYFIRGGTVFFESVHFKERKNRFNLIPSFDIGIGWNFSS